ncbi:TPA: hypothetical protein QDA88_001202 [Burkholderia vietnamiensis]|nr:hypothetical protein [Burkholderia vietnamiensis]
MDTPEKSKSPGHNTRFLREVLRDYKFKFDEAESDADMDAMSDFMTTVQFAGDNESQRWNLFFFSNDVTGIVRAYAQIFNPSKEIPLTTLLVLTNTLNYDHLINANVEMDPERSIRIKSSFISHTSGIPTNEFVNWIRDQIKRGDYLNRLYSKIDWKFKDANQEIEKTKKLVNKSLGLDFQPDFS